MRSVLLSRLPAFRTDAEYKLLLEVLLLCNNVLPDLVLNMIAYVEERAGQVLPGGVKGLCCRLLLFWITKAVIELPPIIAITVILLL